MPVLFFLNILFPLSYTDVVGIVYFNHIYDMPETNKTAEYHWFGTE
jgi:hypothetical protein